MRGNADENVLREDEIRKYRKEICQIASRISLDNDIEVLIMLNDKKTFYDRKNILKFFENIQNEGVVLYG